MPNPHFRVQIISRAGGRSVTAAAAYRSGEVLTTSPSVVEMAAYRAGTYLGNKAKGETFDYTRKEGITWSHIFTPDKAPIWASQRQELWNHAEAAEIRKDARLAREIVASLPREAGPEAWQTMVGDMAAQFTCYGLVVDASIHQVKASDGGDNPHVHLLITDRPVDDTGFRASKKELRFLNRRDALKGWRQTWEELTNRALEAAEADERLSLASYQTRGIDLEPTKPLGPKASKLEKHGIATKEGDENRRIRAENSQRRAKHQAEQGRRADYAARSSTARKSPTQRPMTNQQHQRGINREQGTERDQAQER